MCTHPNYFRLHSSHICSSSGIALPNMTEICREFVVRNILSVLFSCIRVCSQPFHDCPSRPRWHHPCHVSSYHHGLEFHPFKESWWLVVWRFHVKITGLILLRVRENTICHYPRYQTTWFVDLCVTRRWFAALVFLRYQVSYPGLTSVDMPLFSLVCVY